MSTIESRRKRIDAVYAAQPQEDAISKNPFAAPTEEEWGAYLRMCGFTWADACSLWHDPRCTNHDKSKMAEFAQGWHDNRPVVHFVGIQDERQYHNAVKLFGKPDYEWPNASFRIMGECAPGDVVVYGRSAFVVPKKWKKKYSAE
jgi:hypothetical protein